MPARKPSSTKLLSGTWRPDRANPREPRPMPGLPRPSTALPPAAAVQYRRLAALLRRHMPGVGTRVDGVALELAASALAEYQARLAAVLEHGSTYAAVTESGTVMHRARPEVAMAADAWRRVLAALSTFGLTPTSRPKVEGVDLTTADALRVYAAKRPPPPGADPMDILAYRRAERARAPRARGGDSA